MAREIYIPENKLVDKLSVDQADINKVILLYIGGNPSGVVMRVTGSAKYIIKYIDGNESMALYDSVKELILTYSKYNNHVFMQLL